jgi:hypothetical protein
MEMVVVEERRTWEFWERWGSVERKNVGNLFGEERREERCC